MKNINQKYTISATALKPYGPVWQVSAAKGHFALKRIGGPAERLVRSFETLSKLIETGFVAPVIPEISAEHLPYFSYNNQYYQLFQWHYGQHPSFTESSSIRKCARLFAGLHRFSLAFDKFEGYDPPGLITTLKQQIGFIEQTVCYLKQQPDINRIDRNLLSWGDYFLTQARYCLSGLLKMGQMPGYEHLIGFCHNDPAPRNIIIQNDHWFLIDFDLSAWDLCINETAKLAGRVLQANSWRPEAFQLTVDAYSEERKMTDWEHDALPYLLCFPQHFWRILSQRWEEKLKWSEGRFASRLWKITIEEPQRLLFLKSILPGLGL